MEKFRRRRESLRQKNLRERPGLTLELQKLSLHDYLTALQKTLAETNTSLAQLETQRPRNESAIKKIKAQVNRLEKRIHATTKSLEDVVERLAKLEKKNDSL